MAPFKAQNMSNNAAVCPDGGEIGRAQAVQALAAGLQPSVEMNPILIKPEADARSQVIVMGRPWKKLAAGEYYLHKETLWGQITAALDRLRARYDLVIIEGAGSPAELNLRAGDIVNMPVARYAQAPVLLVGDIDRGGIFAQLLGTLWLLPPEERALVRAFVVNKFRGDRALFEDGIRILEEKGGVPVLGVIPYLHDLHIPEEDAVVLESPFKASQAAPITVEIAVIHLPRIANFDDFDPLSAEPGVCLRYVSDPADFGEPHAIILPGSKSTIDDLLWLRDRGLAQAIQALARRGRAVVGICGGYQILGQAIRDPQGVESQVEITPGLGLLEVETVFSNRKATYQAQARVKGGPGWLGKLDGETLNGYEIHMGRTEGKSAWLEITSRNSKPVQVQDGASRDDGRIWGCYLHGLFANQNFRRLWLESLGWRPPGGEIPAQPDSFQAALTCLADAVESSLDMKRLEAILWES